MKELKQLIRDLREDHDLTQREVAAYLGVSQQTYSNYENGVQRLSWQHKLKQYLSGRNYPARHHVRHPGAG